MADFMETDACVVVERYPRTGSDKFRLKSKRAELVRALDEAEIAKLLDLLFTEDIFNTEEKNIVAYEPVPERKMRKLLDILENKVDHSRDPPVLDLFLDFIKDYCGLEELAQQLVNNEGIPEGYREAERAIELAEGMELSDKILGGVVRQVGSTWMSVAHDLGVSNIKIENITSVTREPYQQKFKVFNAWRQKSGFLPDSLVVLLKAFKDNYDNCHVDWPKLCEYLIANKDS